MRCEMLQLHPSRVGLTLSDFKKIIFKNKFPNLVCDIIKYLTNYSIRQYFIIKREKDEYAEKERIMKEKI